VNSKNTPPPSSIEIREESIYDHPKYYDLVFGADCAAEIQFILGCGERFLDKPPTRFFEPACGTGRLIHALAKRGYEIAGLDLNERAIEFCNARLRRQGYSASTFVGDMANFEVETSYDIGFNTINSFRHLDSEKAARSHLQRMGDTIRPGGLYLLGIHLTPSEVPPSETESWSARRGHLAINTHMWTKERDTKNRVERFGIQFDVHRPSGSFRILDELVLRSYTAQQMIRLIRSSKCWEAIETFTFAYDLDDPIDVDGTCEDVVYVLRRSPCS